MDKNKSETSDDAGPFDRQRMVSENVKERRGQVYRYATTLTDRLVTEI